MKWLAKSNLRLLIIGLVLLSTLLAVINMFIASAEVQKQSLIDNTLQHNEGYATKLAQTLQLTIENAQKELLFSARSLAKHWSEPEQIQQILLEASEQNTLFNSMHVANAEGLVLAASANIPVLTGQELLGPGHQHALSMRTAWVSEPFISQLDNLLVTLTAPIFAGDGQFIGYLAGNIYLQQNNLLYRIIGDHYQKDGSYVYVIDQQKRLLYHPDPKRLGIPTYTNPMLDTVLKGKTGSQAVVNSVGVEMLAGYAYVPIVDWGLVSQRPTRAVLDAHAGLMQKIMLNSMPMNFAMLVVIWIFSGFISKPLKVLARNVKKMSLRSTIERVENLNAWYYEAQQLKQAFLLGLENIHDKVDKLQHDADIDPLTGLNNRRLLEQILDTFLVTNTSFCAITFDIDHFKKVNDSYGHSAGDQVLKELARIVLDSSRGNDVSIRLGGEEFLILMANCKLEVAVKIAERLRTTVMQHDFPGVGSVTISLGVAAWPEHGLSPHDTLRIADERLYRAKNQGRNKVCSTEK